MNEHALSRREFLTVSAAGGSLSLAGLACASAHSATPPERPAGQKSAFGLQADPLPKVRIGCVGIGGRGTYLLGNLLGIEGVEIKAVCDTVPARVAAAQKLVTDKGWGEPAGYAQGEHDYENL